MEKPSTQLIRTAHGQTHDRVYLLASVIFQNNYLEKPASQRLVNYSKERGLSLPEVTDGEMLHAAYELAFSALKYQELLENIILDSRFYITQPLSDDQMSLVAVMLFDLQRRKFVSRKCDSDEFIKDVRDMELLLDRFAVKFAASLARWRIKHGIHSIECMLPESVRIKHERAKSLMLYAWVNSLKSSFDEVQDVLKRAGFSRVRSIGQLQGKTFCQDPLCEDTLVFPAQMKAQLGCISLLSNHKLVVQDKACCVGPNAACRLLQEAENGDVLMAGCYSGLAVSHVASLISLKQKPISNSKTTVFMCVGDRTEAQRKKLQQVVNAMGCKNVKLIPGDIHSLDRGDRQFKKVRVILLASKSSLSAISNPIEFILQEDGDTDLLQDLACGSIAKRKLESLVLQQRKIIDRAMQFPKILSVIYTTYSTYPEENGKVVRAVLEQARACGESSWSQTSLAPFSTPSDSKDQFFKLDPTEHNNGCFMAIFTREAPQQIKDPATEILADVTKTTAKSKRKKSQSVRLKRREAKTKGSNTSIKTSVASLKAKESAEVLLAKISSQDSQKSQKIERFERVNSWNHAVVRGQPPPLETVPKVKESTEIVRPRANSCDIKRSPKVELYGKSNSWNKVVHPYPPTHEVHKPAVISLPQVDFPALFPPHTRPRGICGHFQQTQMNALAKKVLHSRSTGW